MKTRAEIEIIDEKIRKLKTKIKFLHYLEMNFLAVPEAIDKRFAKYKYSKSPREGSYLKDLDDHETFDNDGKIIESKLNKDSSLDSNGKRSSNDVLEKVWGIIEQEREQELNERERLILEAIVYNAEADSMREVDTKAGGMQRILPDKLEIEFVAIREGRKYITDANKEVSQMLAPYITKNGFLEDGIKGNKTSKTLISELGRIKGELQTQLTAAKNEKPPGFFGRNASKFFGGAMCAGLGAAVAMTVSLVLGLVFAVPTFGFSLLIGGVVAGGIGFGIGLGIGVAVGAKMDAVRFPKNEVAKPISGNPDKEKEPEPKSELEKSIMSDRTKWADLDETSEEVKPHQRFADLSGTGNTTPGLSIFNKGTSSTTRKTKDTDSVPPIREKPKRWS